MSTPLRGFSRSAVDVASARSLHASHMVIEHFKGKNEDVNNNNKKKN